MNDFIIHLVEMFEQYRSLRVSEKFWKIYESLLRENSSLLHCFSKFIDWRVIKQHLDLEWKWPFFYSNPNINWEFIKDHLEENWGTWQLSLNPCVNLEIVKQTPDYDWDWMSVSANPSITLKIIKDNPNEKWSFYGLSENPNLTFEFILDNLDEDWNWDYLSRKLKMEEVLAVLPEISWTYLSYNENITFDFVCKNLHRDWNWHGLYSKSKIVWMVQKDGKDGKFVPNIDSIKHLIPMYSEKSFYWGFSSNKNVTIDIVLGNLDKDWIWEYLTVNPGIKLQDIKDHPDLRWAKTSIPFNPNVNDENISEYIGVFSGSDNFFEIPRNVSENFENKIKKEWLAVKRIKKWYFK